MATSFEQFCANSPFWNTTLLLEGSYPQFTECFQHVALVWIPCLILILLSPFYLAYLLKRIQFASLPVSCLHVLKMIVSVCLLGVTVAVLVVKARDSHQEDIPDVLYVSEGLKAGCFVLAMIFVQIERVKGVIASPVLWTYWLLMVIGSIIPFYHNIIQQVQESNLVVFATFYVQCGLLVLQLILTSFAETRRQGYQDLSKTTYPSPELTASIPSRICFTWLISLIIRAYKKTLTEEDIYDLTPGDSCDSNIVPFEKAWETEKKRVEALNKNIRPQVDSIYKSVDPGFQPGEKTPLMPEPKKSRGERPPSGGFKHPGERPKKAKSPYKEPSIIRVLWKTSGPLLLTAQIIKTCSDLLTFATPKVTEALLDYVNNRDSEKEWKGYVLACSYFVIQLLVAASSNQGLILAKRIGMRVKAVLIAAVYKKSLTITSIDDDTSAGEIVNLMSVDCQRMEDVTNYIYLITSTPIQLVLSVYLLYEQLDVAVFAGLAVMVAAVPLNVVIGSLLKKYQIAQMRLKDERMKLMSEVLSGIKVLKLYAWEGSFQEKVEAIRKEELDVIRKFNYIIAVLILMFNTMPYLVQLTSFGVYIVVSEEGFLNPQSAFVSLQLFNMLSIPLTVMPLFIPILVQAGVSLGRISDYLKKEDIKPDVVKKDPEAEHAVEISNGEFTWDTSQSLSTLRNINMQVKPGSLVAVVGSVGCGKSSILSAILGEMYKKNGLVTMKSSIAYVPQQAWIQNATLRDNILFGLDFNRRKYEKIIEACALKSDLEILPGGDRTEIGEKGINISGGQKQRVSLARAVYSDNDIFLLDDPLSAVDSHVGKHIFQHVVGPQGVLKNKTRILVTHGIHWLPMVETIIVMSHGTISEVGTYDELLSRDGAFAQFLREHIQENIDADTEVEDDPEVEAMKRSVIKRLESVSGPVAERHSSADDKDRSLDVSRSSAGRRRTSTSTSDHGKMRRQSSVVGSRRLDRRQSSLVESGSHYISQMEDSMQMSKKSGQLPAVGEKLTEEETGAIGKVKRDIYYHYIKAIGVALFLVACACFTLSGAASIFSGIWLSRWTDDAYLANTSNSDKPEYKTRTDMYLGVYGACGVAQGVFVLLYALIAAVKVTDAAGKLHKYMLVNVLRAPMSFFDTTPGGRIVNRFSRDIEVIDNNLPATLKQTFAGIVRVLSTVITISYGVPIFLAVMVPLTIIYILLQIIYIPTSRQVRRIDSITRSPIYVHFSETLSGASSIRAYGVQQRFIQESKRRVDHNFKFYFAGIAANTWLSFNLQFLGNLIVLAAALFAVTSKDIATGVAGLAVSYSTQMTTSLEWLVTMMSEVEINIVSVERVKEYTEIAREAEWILAHHRPDPDWPHSGNVILNAYQTRYRTGLDLVLNDVSCNIKGGEKVGIVGRTGAGKSSMTLALFRLIEAAGGKIVIDGENIADLGLHDLRNRLTILPQEPVIFSGSLRMNLDPFSRHSDTELWNALEHAYLKNFVESLPQGLQYECGEGGSNLSVGQRQLVCLARTLLRRTKILILDEATAAVDFETDELIQKTIRSEFKDSTVLTIAHRLNTILDYDRVMVLDKGMIKEFDSPNALLTNKLSIFYGMAKDAGLV